MSELSQHHDEKQPQPESPVFSVRSLDEQVPQGSWWSLYSSQHDS